MRWLAMSVAAHGALVAAWPAQRPPLAALTALTERTRSPAQSAPTSGEVLEVALVTLAPAPGSDARAVPLEHGAAIARRPVRRESAHPMRPAASAASRRGGPGEDATAGALAMRASGSLPAGEPLVPRAIDLGIEDAAAAIAAVPGDGSRGRLLTPTHSGLVAPDGDGLMVPSGDGTFAHRRSTFRVDVARDGSVSIEDEPNLRLDVGLPCLRCLADDFEKWRDDPYGGHTVNLMGLLPVLRGGFDLSDWIERVAGNDPYQYEKATFLDATRERRAEMSATDRRERTRDALAKLPDLLESVWGYEPWSARERRYVLFKLWDECDDTTSGIQARATILAFIRRRVHGYTAAELEALNRERTSATEFAPYPDE